MSRIELHRGDDAITIEVKREVDENEYTQLAYDNLHSLVGDPRFCKPGYRNDSIVDACIYLGVLDGDIKDLLNMCRVMCWIGQDDHTEATVKADIVLPYAEGWCMSDQAAFWYEIGTLV